MINDVYKGEQESCYITQSLSILIIMLLFAAKYDLNTNFLDALKF